MKSSAVWMLILLLSAIAFGQERPETGANGSASQRLASSEGAVNVADDLRTAYYGEANSQQRYLVYAAKADEEGYGQVASMFRAIAHGEGIHAERIASLIGTEVAAPAPASEPVVSLTTRENLESSVAEQKYEKDVMYPSFIEQARNAKNVSVERVLMHNMAAEPTHMAWFQQALKDLKGYQGSNVDFLVCSQCGNTVRSLSEAVCPICHNPKSKFERIR